MSKRKNIKKQGWLIVLLAFFTALFGALATGIIYVAVVIKQLPSATEIKRHTINQSTKLYDRTGQVLLYEIHGEEKRTVVPFDEIPDSLKWATLAAEDANFYKQPAFSWKAMARAFLVNLKERRVVQGGSTITQQLAKNTFLNKEKTLSRKIKELILALELESRYSKDEILWLYLNQVAYGSNAYGVEAASQMYFSKSAKDLNLAETAILAALPKAPTHYSPWGNHTKELLERKDYLLERLVRLDYVSAAQKDEAKKVKVNFSPQTVGNIKAPHFSLAVKAYLVSKYGEDLITNGGLKVTTTLDFKMQQIAERVVAEGAFHNEEFYGGKNAALVAEDPKTGQVLALVGSRDYFDTKNDGNFNIATLGLRQPGSALKPFVYLSAFMQGYTPKTIVFDVPTEFAAHEPNCPVYPDFLNKNKDCFHPQNFDEKFRGPVTLEEGLSQSINVPSVKVLYLAHLDNVLKTISKFGVTTLKEKGRYGLSLVLGGGEVKLLELVNAYAVLASEGVSRKPVFILKLEDEKGKIIEEYHDKASRVVSEQYPRIINQILSDKQLRAGLFQNSLALTLFPDKEVALKTGTTNDYRDAWALGYTPSLVVGIWAGNNDNTPMHKKGSSILAAVPIWSAFLNEVLKNYPHETFTKPEPTPRDTKPMMNGQFVYAPVINNKSYPQIHSILYYLDKNDPLGPTPEDPRADPQFNNWEQTVVNWARFNISSFSEYNQPLTTDLLQTPSFFSGGDLTFANLEPENGTTVNTPVLIRGDIQSKEDLVRIELYFNRELLEKIDVSGNFYKLAYSLSKPLLPQNLIEIRAFNKSGKKFSTKVIVFH